MFPTVPECSEATAITRGLGYASVLGRLSIAQCPSVSPSLGVASISPNRVLSIASVVVASKFEEVRGERAVPTAGETAEGNCPDR